MNVFPVFKKKYLLLLLIPPLFLLIYWVKSFLGINLFPFVSISDYPPFKYVSNHVIWAPSPGVVFKDTFDGQDGLQDWKPLWMREAGTAATALGNDGADGTRCLVVTNRGIGTWTCEHKKLVEANKGDVFSFSGSADISGKEASAAISVAVLDKHHTAIGWNVFKKEIPQNGFWVSVEKTFTITDANTAFIAFRLVGAGSGVFRFDDLVLKKIK